MMKLNDPKKDIVVVIRSAGERTLGLCKEIVQRQVDEDQIQIIEEKPFFKAVKKTIEIGSESSAKYLLALDADMILYPDTIDYAIHSATEVDFDKHLRLTFFVMDKFRGKTRAGIHLYNNKHSKKIYEFLKEINTDTFFLRPESENMRRCAEQNNLHFKYFPNQIVGMHDYYQYYKDLYIKYRLRLKRCEKDGIVDEVKTQIKTKLKENIDDTDYLFVYEIFTADNVDMDISEFLKKCGITEKPPLTEKNYTSIIESLSDKSVMEDSEKEFDENMRKWVKSYESFKDFVDTNFRCDGLDGNTAIYGRGIISELLLMSKKNLNIKAIIDRNIKETDSSICEIPIIPIDQIERYNIDNIIIASLAHKDEIRNRINTVLANKSINIIAPMIV